MEKVHHNFPRANVIFCFIVLVCIAINGCADKPTSMATSKVKNNDTLIYSGVMQYAYTPAFKSNVKIDTGYRDSVFLIRDNTDSITITWQAFFYRSRYNPNFRSHTISLKFARKEGDSPEYVLYDDNTDDSRLLMRVLVANDSLIVSDSTVGKISGLRESNSFRGKLVQAN